MKRTLKGFGVFFLILVILAVAGNQERGMTTPPRPTISVKTLKLTAQEVDPRLLVSNPNGYDGKALQITGTALNVDQQDGYTWVNVIPAGSGVGNNVVVELRPPVPSLLSQECYTFYGVGAGTTKVTRTLTGATNDVPLVQGQAYDHAPFQCG